MYAATAKRDLSLLRLDAKAHRDSAEGIISSATFQYFQYSMYHSELCAQLEQGKATESQGSTEGGEEVSGQDGGLNLNLGNDALARDMVGSDKQ